MKTLLVLRHAKSSWKDAGLHDHDRPLNRRGLRDAPRVGRLLAAEGLVPQAILSSTATRARRTAELLAETVGFDGAIALRSDLYLAEPATYIAALNELADEVECAMVVGHNPGMEELVERLSGDDESMPTAALAVLRLPVDSWAGLSLGVRGELSHLWRPKEVFGGS